MPVRSIPAFVVAAMMALSSGCSTRSESTRAETDVQPAAPAETAVAVDPTPAPAVEETVVEIRETAPTRYVVQPGDTLWDISAEYLYEPWYWPEIWHVNPQIRNPHLIYPGDVLTLYYDGDRPRVQVTGGPRVAGLKTARLGPQIRVEAIDEHSNEIPIQAIQEFIIHPMVVTKRDLDTAPYVVGGQDYRLIFGNEDSLYVRNLDKAEPGTGYAIVRGDSEVHDPKTGEPLGYTTTPVGDARLLRSGDPATLRFLNPKREALVGDKLFRQKRVSDHSAFFPHPPASQIDASVVSLFDAISMVGALQIAVISAGERDGVDEGSVFRVWEEGLEIDDPLAPVNKRSVRLPAERAGTVMVFQTFDKISYALVMDATRPIQYGDVVRTP
ncbi:MAG: LysM peptidoglycan-binding domain-containing protein [Gammaproteobacteria bacterium]|jgi:hypothetical protein|nr:LysM peptidoglycan-binding domain-containing protein [Gammaproteobacteria bacterium]